MSRPLAALPMFGALLALTLVLAACDSDSSPTPEMPSPTARATMSPHPGAVIITPVPTPTPTPPPDEHQQVVVFDLAAGEFTPLLPPLAEEGEWYIVRSFHPRFTPDGDHVWAAERESMVSRRYDLAGNVVEKIDGVWGVEEHTSGGRTYFRQQEAGPSGPAILVDGEETVFEDTVVQHLATLSPDGRYMARFMDYEEPGATLIVTEVDSGQVLATAEEVGFCQCDGGPALVWSPSSRFLTYGDFDRGWAEGGGGKAGSYALDVESGQHTLLTPNAWGFGDEAWVGNISHVAVRDGWAVVLDLTSGSVARRIAQIPEDGGLFVAGGVVVVMEQPGRSDARGTAYALKDGALLGEWDGQPRPVRIEGGIAYVRYNVGACSGVSLHYPSSAEPVCIPGHTAQLTPDGRHVAIQDGPRVTIFKVGAELEEIARFVGPTSPRWQSATHLGEWNERGTHLLIDVGFGLF
ncbi:MAG: hypothetical protein M0R73_05445 [Dehalococcoidia bacterium]|nr:hypothetical protein [Dehalococcoidia bacterium]